MDRLLITLVLGASLALAGCTGDDEPAPGTGTTTPATSTPATSTPVTSTPVTSTPASPTPPTPGNGSDEPAPYVPYDVAVSGFPSVVEAGKNFTFRLNVTGGVAAESDHVGAHYGNVSAPDAPANTTTYGRGCPHFNATLPGSFLVTCNVPAAGTWYFRGHARVDGVNNSWGEELRLVVREAWNGTGNYTLAVTGVPSRASVGENVTFTLQMEGPAGVSNHFGAHYGPTSSDAPSTQVYTSGCSHQGAPTPVPTSSTVTCVFDVPGVYYLRGHLRIEEGLPPATSNYWTGEYAILVE